MTSTKWKAPVETFASKTKLKREVLEINNVIITKNIEKKVTSYLISFR